MEVGVERGHQGKFFEQTLSNKRILFYAQSMSQASVDIRNL